MRQIVLLAAAAAAATPALATAQTVAGPFTGARAEGVLGYDALSDGNDQDSSSSNGIVYGVAVGYDFQAGPVLAGVEGEITGSTTDTRTDDLVAAGDRFRLDAGRDLYLGGRVGYAVTPQALLYAKGGYTNAQLDVKYDAGAVSVRDHADLDGFRVGAGVEYQMRGNTFIKGEYRYSNYSEVDGYDADVDRNQIVAGLGFRF